MFDDRKVYKYFSGLNFTEISIKLFTCNNTVTSYFNFQVIVYSSLLSKVLAN